MFAAAPLFSRRRIKFKTRRVFRSRAQWCGGTSASQKGGLSSPGKSSDPKQSGDGERQASPCDGDECAQLHLEQNGTERHYRSRKEQGKDESNRSRASNHCEIMPAKAVWDMQAGGDRQPGSR